MRKSNNSEKLSNEFLANEFLRHVGEKYDVTKKSFIKQYTSKNIKKYKGDEYYDDHFQNSLLKCRESIDKRGFKFSATGGRITASSAMSFFNYFYMAFKNEVIVSKIKSKKIDDKIEVEPQDYNYGDDGFDFRYIPESLQYNQEEDQEQINKQYQQYYLIEDIFDYVSSKYVPKEANIFKFYFKTMLSYKQISYVASCGTGEQYSVGYCWKTVNKITLDVRDKFKIDRLKRGLE
jgi:hypothetical protein